MVLLNSHSLLSFLKILVLETVLNTKVPDINVLYKVKDIEASECSTDYYENSYILYLNWHCTIGPELNFYGFDES